MNYVKFIDHTQLKPESTREQIDKIINEAKEYGFKSICVNPTHVKYSAEQLKGTDVLVCTVIGFPLGASTKEVKAFETKNAIENGASEIDMVINIGALKDCRLDEVKDDIESVVKASNGKTVKVIIETVLLTDEEKVTACKIAKEAGADFVKTSTGFSFAGATIEDVKLMRETVGDGMGVKASGGIKTLADVKVMVDAGANRIGTSSSISIIHE